LTGLALGLALLAPALRATTVEPPSFDTLVSRADYVVRAVVKSATPEWHETDGKRYISTVLELDVREVIKGTPPTPLMLTLLGGRIGEVEFAVTGMPIFEVGDESVLFVYGAEKKLYPLVSMMHGVYPILREAKSGQDYMLRSNGMPLYSTADVALPMSRVSDVLATSATARPLTPSAFIQEIRRRAARGTNTAHEN
jgi:hypothetical protein